MTTPEPQAQLGGKEPVLRIYQDVPDDLQDNGPKVEPPPVDPADFISEADVIEETPKEPAAASDPTPEADDAERVDAEEVTDDTDAEFEKIKKEIFLTLIEPETVVEFMDMIFSRGGSMMPGTSRDDWQMDQVEKDILKVLFATTVKEENITMMPAKYWLFLAILFIYGFKSIDNVEVMNKYKEEKDLTTDELRAAHTVKMERLDFEIELAEAERSKRDLLRDLKGTNGQSNGNGYQKPGYRYNDDGSPVIVKGKHLKKPGDGSKAQRDEVEEVEVVH